MATSTSPAPAAPTYRDKDLERLIAAVIAADGWYVERSLEIPMLCEADVIGTRLSTMTRRLAEAKSGKCGASDAFKFESQRRFLDIDAGAMVVPSSAPREIDVVGTWGEFAVLRTDLTGPNVISAVSSWLGSSPPPRLVEAWLRGYTVMDGLIAIASDSKIRLASPTIMASWTAFHGVNAPTWIRMSLDERSMTAYAAFAAMPHAGAARAREIDGTSAGRSPAFRDSWAFGKHPTIHAVLLLEWLNRLEVVRLAAESSLVAAAPVPKTGFIVVGPPRAFRDGVDALRHRPDLARHLPTLLQAFIFRWGGILIPDAGEEADIGLDLGLDADQVRDSIALLDTMFPTSTSWLRTTLRAQWLTLVPYPMQGLGVIYRDSVKPGWDVSLNSTLRRALRERERVARGYLLPGPHR
jgi:hypothetical protein